MLDTNVYHLPDTHEVMVELKLTHEVTVRVDAARHRGEGLAVAHGAHRRMFRDLIEGEFSGEFADEVSQERSAVATLGQELATLKADRDRLARVVDKLTGA